MRKLDTVKSLVNNVLLEAPEPRRGFGLIHLYGVSSFCALFAHKRGADPEIAAISGLFHDIYTAKTGITAHHAHSSAEMVRPVIRDLGVFSTQEQTNILSAIFHHSDKEHSHDAYDEILKDADVLQAHLPSADSTTSKSRKPRLERISNELGLHLSPVIHNEAMQPAQLKEGDLRKRLAGTAEELAARKIVGHPEDRDYIDITQYWPDVDIAAVLKEGWCAAFVYHCCMKEGFYLPIRIPNTPCRLAAVDAWYGWAKTAKLFIEDSESLVPQRGDIVIYRNIVTLDKKDDNKTPTDHMGIVLSVNHDGFFAAEGNIGNNNISGVIFRKHHKNVEGFIRISAEYEYDGWKYDYKSGGIRTEPFRVESESRI